MILFVNENKGILFLSGAAAVVTWITEIIKKNSLVTIIVDKISNINGD